MSFHWQTDDEADEALHSEESGPPGNPRLRRAMWILGALALIAVGAFLAWRTVQQRAEATEARVEADVLSTHELARQAAGDGDEEIYLSVTAQEDDAWRETQQALLRQDLLFAGAAQYYDLTPQSSAPHRSDVILDANFSQATVHSYQNFVLSRPDEVVTLRQAQSYRLAEGGWRVAPPPRDFWSTQILLHGNALSLQYPERDEAVALRLMSQLERLIPEMCALPGLQCPSDMHITVRLLPDPATLVDATGPEAYLSGATMRDDIEIELPAPSLVGQPLDNQAQAIVVRAYAARTIAPLINSLSNYECCARGLLARAIVERQLYHLGLRPWPLSADDYEALMEEGMTLGNALVLQAREATTPLPETWRQMLSLVEFLEASLPSEELLSYMGASFDYWLLRAREPGDFVVQWTEYVYARSRSAQLAADLDPLPAGTVQLTCFESGAVAVQEYVLQGAGWQHGLTHATPEGWQVEAVFSLPADYGHVIKESQRDDGGQRVARYVWRYTGGSNVLFQTTGDDEGARLFSQYDGSAPHWRYTVLSPDHTALRTSLEQEWWQLDLTVCDGGDCEGQEHVARPRWSPDGAQLLLEVRPETRAWGRDDLTLFRAGNRGENAVEVGRGFAPTWLGVSNYAFLRAARAESGHELLVAATRDDNPHVVATSADFVALLEEELPGAQALQLERLQVSPRDQRLILVQATHPSPITDVESDSFLFAARLSPDMQALERIDLLFHSDGDLDFRLSPNGRRVAVSEENQWTVVDLQSGARQTLGAPGAPAWSPDGEWLAQSRDYHIMLHAPALDYKRPIVHELGDCPFSSLQWQSR